MWLIWPKVILINISQLVSSLLFFYVKSWQFLELVELVLRILKTRRIPTLTWYLHTSLRYNPRTTDPLLELLSRLRQSRPSRLRSPCHVTVWEGAGWDHHVTLHLLLPAAVLQVVPASHRDHFSHSLRSDQSNGQTVSKIIVKKNKIFRIWKRFLWSVLCWPCDVLWRCGGQGPVLWRMYHENASRQSPGSHHVLGRVRNILRVHAQVCITLRRNVWHIADSFAQKPQYNKFRKRK